jgi:chemotaxis protein MotB
MPSPPPIIIKKVVGHGGHHGGAWKVAYADFVTAMMALFIVLWLMNSSEKIKKAVGGYFKDPSGKSELIGSDMRGVAENFVITKDNMKDLKEQLEKTIREVPNFSELVKHIDMTVTNEGLRIELTESEAGEFFESGSTKMSQDGSELVKVLAEELGKLPNHLAIEGHTDSQPYPPGAMYTNWELSVDRANTARRLMQANGIREDQVSQVRGFADQHLRKSDAPQDPSNRRISLIVQYQSKTVESASEEHTETQNTAGPEKDGGSTKEVAAPETPKARAETQQNPPEKK